MVKFNVKTKWYNKFKDNELPSTVEGKVFAITGTTSGTGYVAAKTVGEKGGTVILLNRKSARVDAMLSKLKQDVPDGQFIAIECDLQDFSSVRNAAKEISSKYDKMYCLCNNAGIMATPDEATKDGYDTQMQTNHLSHFLLTALLFPLLEAEAKGTGDARIVNHSSEARHQTPQSKLEKKYLEKNGGNLGGDQHSVMFKGGKWDRYFHSKLANSVFSYGLHEKLRAQGSAVKAIDAHPGSSATSLPDHLNGGAIFDFVITYVLGPMFQTAEDGAMGILKGMMATTAESGVLYGPTGMGGMRGPAVIIKPKKHENDPESIKMLWETSEKATDTKFL